MNGTHFNGATVCPICGERSVYLEAGGPGPADTTKDGPPLICDLCWRNALTELWLDRQEMQEHGFLFSTKRLGAHPNTDGESIHDEMG